MKVLGFDPASLRNLGWSLVNVKNGFSCKSGTIVISPVPKSWQALWPIFQEVDSILKKKKPELVIIEDTMSFRGGFVTGQVSKCLGVILACCGKNKIPVLSAYPTHVKKVVTGNGRAKKPELKKAVIAKIKELTGKIIKFDSDHACDATANVLCWYLEKGKL